DVLRDEARLPRRHADVFRLGAHQVLFFTSVLRSPECARKVRVGANSPSLWPTICSEMNTGTCLRPSWTAIVWPTICGNTVDVRDQVQHLLRARVVHRLDLLQEPLLHEGPLLAGSTQRLSFPRRRPGTLGLRASLCFWRVRSPGVGPPPGVTGCRPLLDLPSPPPCGWSTGFMAEPRTAGRFPSQRLRPALPTVTLPCSTFPT